MTPTEHNTNTRRALASACALLLMIPMLLAGCGGSSSSTTTSAGTSTDASTEAAANGTIGRDPAVYKVAWPDIDYLDPALAYSYGWTLVGQSYLGLLGYSHESAEKSGDVVPGLAEAMPKISADHRTYTFTLRPGLRYSNGKPVKVGDFKYAVERMFKINSPAVGFVSTIEGAEAYAKDPGARSPASRSTNRRAPSRSN